MTHIKQNVVEGCYIIDLTTGPHRPKPFILPCFCLYVSGQLFLNEMIFDLNVWQNDKLVHHYAPYEARRADRG